MSALEPTQAPHSEPTHAEPVLTRALTLPHAIALNVSNMVGIGPFMTISAIFLAMNGPPAILAWILAAVLVLCDGMVWSELGAALPGSGGTYHFLKEIYGPTHPTWGPLMPFLYIWQFLISGTLETASGYLLTMAFLRYAVPNLDSTLAQCGIVGGINTLAAIACLVVTLLLCRRISLVGWLGTALCVGTFAAMIAVAVAGLTHVNPDLWRIPAEGYRWSGEKSFSGGLAAAMTLAIYNFIGYYNICHLGDEVREPGRTIPRAVIWSIGIVATLYVLMNVGILSVIPWQEAANSQNVTAELMERLFGRTVAVTFTWLVVWAAVACGFAITLGYSRIPYAAACQGDFFAVFAKLDRRGQYPIVSLLTVGMITAICCYLPLEDVINAAVVVRILVQFIGQIFALHLMRTTRPEIELPFRAPLYPAASLVALVGWLFVLCMSERRILVAALAVTGAGLPAYFIWKLCAARRQTAASPALVPDKEG